MTTSRTGCRGSFRLVATDLDGTLLRTDGSVSARTRAALARASANGLHVVLVTGRPPRWVPSVAREAGVDGVAVCANGAYTYELASGAVVAHRPMPPDVAAHLVHGLRMALPGVVFAFEIGVEFAREPDYAPGATFVESCFRVADAEELAREPVTKLLAKHPEHRVADMIDSARVVAGDRAVVTHSTDTLLEITNRGVTKATSLALVCERLGIAPAEVLAFGDGHNDLPLLEWAGCGVMMRNGDPRLVAAADCTAPSNDDDGVAVTLESLLDGQPYDGRAA